MTGLPKRVLVVDNDPDVLGSVEYNLKTADYEVLTAGSPETARELLSSEIIHLAIIDIRLKYEDRAEDLSGFDVAQELPDYIPCVIFTAYENKETIRRALGKVRAKEILDKKAPDAASRLVDIVDKLFASDVKVNFNLEIEGSLDLGRVAGWIEVPISDKELRPSAEDVRQVFQALFHDAVAIYTTSLLPPEPAPTLTQAGSVLLQARPRYVSGWGVPVVVKLSAGDEISREATNYRVIKPFLGGQRLAVLDGVAYSRQIGGLVYSLIGAQDWEAIRTFGEVFLDNDTDKVIGLLEQFFSQTFGALFKDAPRETINLISTYTKQLRLTPEKLRMALEEFHPEALREMRVRFKGLKGSFRNPFIWALSEGRFRHFEVVSRKCLCHGDLHSLNILVDAEGHFWLIDFARVAESHALRDFAELEIDIKFNLLPVVDLAALLPFEQALLIRANFQDAPLDISFGSNRLDHAYRVVIALRRIAADLIDLEGDTREYYQALFLHTLNIMRLRHISIEKKEHALLSAALICQRLEDWPEWEFVPTGMSSSKPPSTQSQADESTAAAERSVTKHRTKGQPQWWSRLAGAGAFFLVGTAVVALLWWGMRYFTPDWQEHVATLLYLAVFAIIAFALLGLVTGPTAIEALQKIVSNLFGKSNRPYSDEPGGGKKGEV